MNIIAIMNFTVYEKPFHNQHLRKKDSNTLYTINSLNELIKKLNNGVLDTSYSINWNDYKNTILLTDSDKDVRLIPTNSVD